MMGAGSSISTSSSESDDASSASLSVVKNNGGDPSSSTSTAADLNTDETRMSTSTSGIKVWGKQGKSKKVIQICLETYPRPGPQSSLTD